MTLQYIYHCDGPNCETSTKEPERNAWFLVQWLEPNPDETAWYYFCRSECLLGGMVEETEPSETGDL